MKEEIRNPWEGVKESDLYTKNDRSNVEVFNSKLGRHPKFIDLNLLPEPYMGNKNAKVILLFSNPGFGGNETTEYNEIPKFKETIIKNLTHANEEYPYYYLNPNFTRKSIKGETIFTDGGKWILDKTKQLRKDSGLTLEEFSTKIFTLQLHPFHSAEFKALNKTYKGYEYTMQLFSDSIDRAIKGEALIVCARAYKEWNKEYQKLNNNDKSKDLKIDLNTNFVQMLHPRKLNFTPKHFGKDSEENDNYKKLITELNKSL